jgi:hypothetical protein
MKKYFVLTSLCYIFLLCSCSNNENLLETVRPCDTSLKALAPAIWSTKWDRQIYFNGDKDIRQDDNYVVVADANNRKYIIIDKKDGTQQEFSYPALPFNIHNGLMYIADTTEVVAIDLQSLQVKSTYKYETQTERSLDIDVFENKVYVLMNYDNQYFGYSSLDDVELVCESVVKAKFSWGIYDAKLYRNKQNELCAIFIYNENDTNIAGIKSIKLGSNEIEYAVEFQNSRHNYFYGQKDHFKIDRDGRVYLNCYTIGKQQSYVMDLYTGKILYSKANWLNNLSHSYSSHYFTTSGDYPTNLVINATGEVYPNIRHDSIIFNVLTPLFIHKDKYFVTTDFGESTYFVNLVSGCVEYFLTTGFGSTIIALSSDDEFLVIDSENSLLYKYKVN